MPSDSLARRDDAAPPSGEREPVARPQLRRPDFLGIGAQKAATTWLFAQLDRHPGIAFPAGKEIHFWDRRAGRDARDWLACFADVPAEVRAGEITPAYACLDADSIAEIHACAPRLRIVYSLRNPIERAWSAARMALERAELAPDEASDAWFLDHFRSRGSLARGDYEGCLARWHAVFPAGQVAVVLYDEIVADPRAVLARLAGHLGVDPHFWDDAAPAALREPVLRGPPVPLRPSLAKALHELYDERIDALAARLGRDLAHWKAV